MSIWLADKNRTVIPRWRDLHVTLALGELASTSVRDPVVVNYAMMLEKRRRDWTLHRTLSFAADFLSCALSQGQPAEARDAAEFIQEYAPANLTSLRELAEQVVAPSAAPNFRDLIVQPLSVAAIKQELHTLRHYARAEPRNAFLWVDIARRYEILGERRKATEMIDIALRLAPANRFVLRSATRLYVHQDDLKQARKLLQSINVAAHDPWIAAAEIAVACADNRTPRFIKAGRQMLDSGNHSPFHLSELASAIATLELASGNTRRARKLIETSLVEASENSLAQVAWINRNVCLISVDHQVLSTRISSEAGAWESFRMCDWKGVLGSTSDWLNDQPFSSRPAILGSYTASVCMDLNEESLSFANLGLMANPDDPLLLNNAAFALARLGRLEDARRVYLRIDASRINDMMRTAYLATGGLLEFRAGKAMDGERLYREAIQLARSKNDSDTEALASLFLAIEQINSSPASGRTELASAVAALKKSRRPDLQYLSKRFELGAEPTRPR